MVNAINLSSPEAAAMAASHGMDVDATRTRLQAQVRASRTTRPRARRAVQTATRTPMPEPQICPIDADYIRLRTRERGLPGGSLRATGPGTWFATFRTRQPEGQPGQRQYYVRHLVWSCSAAPAAEKTAATTSPPAAATRQAWPAPTWAQNPQQGSLREAAARGAFQSLAFRAGRKWSARAATRNSKLSTADVARIRTHAGASNPG